MGLIVLTLAASALIGSVEIAKRKFLLDTNITRRITHIGAALIAAASPYFVSRWTLIFVCLFFSVVMLLGRRSAWFSSIHNVDRRSFGDVYLPLGEAVAAFMFLPYDVGAFQFGVLVMGISDAAAGLIGERYGRHNIRFFGGTKSIEGSLAFFICTLILAVLFVPTFGYQVILIAVVLTAVEFLSVYGLDNLVLPIIGAYLIQFLVF